MVIGPVAFGPVVRQHIIAGAGGTVGKEKREGKELAYIILFEGTTPVT
jgi:hypothetical protein